MKYGISSFISIVIAMTILVACEPSDDSLSEMNPMVDDGSTVPFDAQARIAGVESSGEEQTFSLAVTIKSPDLGCSQYADWWEVISPDSSLLHRRILTHSHVNEQPFTRSGGPIVIEGTREVIVRAHMNNTGYGQIVMRGSVHEGFHADTLPAGFAQALERVDPLPNGCAF
ncbi:MAG: hypothetical protein KTR24_09425 [Saprospiraceae bacterium]|nr:hypothetical protein [Saprospiraceae bacterium]